LFDLPSSETRSFPDFDEDRCFLHVWVNCYNNKP
jgi:hypothetical protein